MLIRLLRRFYNACWYGIAFIVLTTAVCVSVIRLTLPHINNYRENIQDWISDYTGHPLEIKSLDANWQGWVPSLYLNNITIFNTEKTGIITSFNTATVSIDPFDSLLQGELMPIKLAIGGLNLNIIRRPDGSIDIAESSKISKTDTQHARNALAGWLLKQRNISIEESAVTFIDQKNEVSPVHLADVYVHLKHASGRTQFDGTAKLPAVYGDQLSFALDIFGDITTPHWSGEMYVSGKDIYPESWIKRGIQNEYGVSLNSAPVNFSFWSRWQNASLSTLEGEFTASDIRLWIGNSREVVQEVISAFSLVRNNSNEFVIDIEIQKLLTSNGLWPESHLRIAQKNSQTDGKYTYVINASYINLADLTPFLNRVFGITPNSLDISVYNFGGNLIDSIFIIDESKPAENQIQIQSKFNQISINNPDDQSFITGLSGYVNGNISGGILSLDSSSINFYLPSTFSETITFHKISGDLEWKHDDFGWSIHTKFLEGNTYHFNSHLRGEISFNSAENSPYLNIGYKISNLNLENVIRYIPIFVPEETRNWCETALVTGEISSLDLLMRGNLAEYPFSNNNGRLEIIANVQDATLDYHPDWIPVDKLEAEFLINENNLIVNASSGKIINSEILEAHAVIDQLNAESPIVKLNGKMKGHTRDAMSVIENSPLSESEILAELSQHKIEGSLGMVLELDIPLDERLTEVDGTISFHDVTLDSSSLGITLDHIAGDLRFTRDIVTTDQIKARYFKQEVDLDIRSEKDGLPIININGDADQQFIADQLGYFFPGLDNLKHLIKEHIDGKSQWSATLTSDSGENDVNSKKLEIKSSLAGLAINLPDPLGKNYQSVPLVISTILTDQKQKTIEFSYGEIVTGRISLDESPVNNKLTSAILTFGKTADTLNKNSSGIIINGNIENLSLSEWFGFFNTIDTKTWQGQIQDLQVDISTGLITFFNKNFNNVSLNIDSKSTEWNIKLSGEDIKGEIILPNIASGNSFRANFEKIKISENELTSDSEKVSPLDLPAMDIKVNDFVYENIQLGEMTLSASKQENGIFINKLIFTKPDIEISGQGTWSMINNRETSDFTFGLNAKFLDAMLQTFDYGVASIEDGETSLMLNAHWYGSPLDFSIANMNGNLEMNIKKGVFLEIEPNAGRLFGLLSLQTLPRRLSLDFSDLFSKGLSFDEIVGDFTIESGNAYTNNLALTGPSADIQVTGRTGLVEQDYDQIVTVIPQFADSLPVASALFGPIGVGVGAVLFLAGEMFESLPEQIDNLLKYQYTIKGKWDDPVVEKYTGVVETKG